VRIISVIENQEVIKATLKYLGLWLIKSRPAGNTQTLPRLNDNEYFYP
jgi:hypothetical protein